ncbi:sigma-54-dependent Fis family transcriptional regulator [Acanthopleuribacter pedis]|uniref:Sigma-54-dependent Fis family transcriptional regulator n=1 Tax=Acanthopleuribacter pedis TaxID=442870 RepID=A0A8J7QA84_9BACT|nr:sigma-54-dependent Fis family transcriptional regulator [Acanthopleuribacter pedis]MBO1322807.1 sigma-54-dependent Fis family transcriptional regulator [Acanthopleuribacter pedis]
MISDQERLAFLEKATNAICSHVYVTQALQSCVQLLHQFMPAQRMYLDLFENDFGTVRTVATATRDTAKRLDKPVPMSPEQRREILGFRNQHQTDHVFWFDDASQDPLCRRMLQSLGARVDVSLIGTYPIYNGQPIGAVVLIAPGFAPYQAHHRERFKMLQNLFGILIHNAKQFRELLQLRDLLAEENQYLKREIASDHDLIGADAGLSKTMRKADQVAAHDSPVLILGETGVGKDLVAHYIHRTSARCDGPFITMNCGAIHESLIDSELFGHEKGAFTGALTKKRGRFERAQGGTLFLDEVGELSQAAQVRLLRVIQNKEIERIGGVAPIKIDVRIIAATHRDLHQMVQTQQFRQDLWFRLNVFPLRVPPLRERREDIPALVAYFMDRLRKRLKIIEMPHFKPNAFDLLLAYAWPGNVRELANVIERGLILAEQGEIDLGPILPEADARVPAQPQTAKQRCSLETVMKNHIRSVLEQVGGRIEGSQGAAAILAMHPSTLRSKIKKLGITYNKP